jgi:D-lactate dehydrogenase
MKILCYSAQKYDREYFAKTAMTNVHIDYVDCLLSTQTVKLAISYDAICIFVNDQCDQHVLKELHRLGIKCILLRCAGYNNVDIQAAKELGIFVARVPKYSPNAVAEHAVGLLLCLNRKIHKAYNRVRENNFSLNGLVGFDLCGKTVGIIGYGEIGKVFANIMSGFSCNVIVYDPYVLSVNDGHKKVDLSYLLSHSDIISLHCPLSSNNRHLIDEDALSKVKSNAIIINTSRGALVDTKAVFRSLKNKLISGFAIDVYEEESTIFFEDHSNEIIVDDVFERLLTFPNVLITGHQAFLTNEALTSIAKVTLDNALRILSNKECENII